MSRRERSFDYPKAAGWELSLIVEVDGEESRVCLLVVVILLQTIKWISLLLFDWIVVPRMIWSSIHPHLTRYFTTVHPISQQHNAIQFNSLCFAFPLVPCLLYDDCNDEMPSSSTVDEVGLWHWHLAWWMIPVYSWRINNNIMHLGCSRQAKLKWDAICNGTATSDCGR